MIFFEGGGSLVLDPTAGVIARGTFDEVVSGKPSAGLVEFYGWGHPEIIPFVRRVTGALDGGLIRPSHLLYYFESGREYAQFISSTGAPYFMTPGGAVLRHRDAQASK
jgi:hypothetical protein